ncbi:MAG: HD domain-containing protein [Candidatus Thorarchaeota archaeon]
MLEKEIISIIHNYAFNNSEKDDIHGFPHVERVFKLCIQLGKELGANLHIIEIAALLHDIGRIKEKKDISKRNHAEISAEMALGFLNSNDFNFSKVETESIIHCIRSHSFSNNTKPKTLEAKILSDADKLDALGAIGLYRTIGFTIKRKGGLDQVIEHLENKILRLKDRMYLDISKKMAEERELIIYDFYKKILKKK